jgi:hypothetical protein
VVVTEEIMNRLFTRVMATIRVIARQGVLLAGVRTGKVVVLVRALVEAPEEVQVPMEMVMDRSASIGTTESDGREEREEREEVVEGGMVVLEELGEVGAGPTGRVRITIHLIQFGIMTKNMMICADGKVAVIREVEGGEEGYTVHLQEMISVMDLVVVEPVAEETDIHGDGMVDMEVMAGGM